MLCTDTAFAVPEPDEKIWRFISVAELVSLLSKRALFFSRVDKLDDPYEGSLPRLVVARAEAGFEGLTAQGRELMRNTRQQVGYVQSKLWTMVNCWYLNEHESAAMWKLHASDGVAIQSTFSRFGAAVAASPRKLVVGVIKYLDYETQGWDVEQDPRTIASIFHKRASFEHERELRAAVSEPLPGGVYNVPEGPGYVGPEGLPGIYVEVDLATLIGRIHVSPGSPLWFRDVVKTIAGLANLDGTVVQSSVDGDPLW